MEIKKKTWLKEFEQMLKGKKNADVRLADFECKEGDILILEEYNPETKTYTGRVIKKRIKNLNKVNLLEFHSAEDMKKYGHYVIELE